MNKALTSKVVLAGAALVMLLSLAAAPAQADLVMNLRFTDGTTSKELASGFTGDVTVDVWATVTGAGAADEGFAYMYFSAISRELSGGAFVGDITGTTLHSVANSTGSATGVISDLNADGVNDWGSTGIAPNTSFAKFRANPYPIYASNGGGVAITGGYEWKVGSFTVNVSSLETGSTYFDPVVPTWTKSGLTYSGYWYEDSTLKNSELNSYLAGTSVLFTVAGGGTQDPAAISLTSAVNATIIAGGSASVGGLLANSAAAGSAALNYTLTVGDNASVTEGAVVPASGSLEAQASVGFASLVSSDVVGVHDLTFTASDPAASNSPQQLIAQLTVKGHAVAALSTDTINFGNVLKGASGVSQGFTLGNAAPAGVSAALDLDAVTPAGSAALGTDLATFAGLAAGSSNPYSATLATGAAGSFAKTVTLDLSDEDLPGAANSQLVLNLSAVVGNATADGTGAGFGPALLATVANGGSYANLESQVTEVAGVGGQAMVGTMAKILAGENVSGTAANVSMAWRVREVGESTGLGVPVVSDVVDLNGVVGTYVLLMDYNENDPSIAGNEADLAAAGLIYLAWLNPAEGWVNAGLGAPVLGDYDGNLTVGNWGVNTASNTVWAVVDHTSEFAVVPEPATMGFLALGGLAMIGAGLARRRKA